MNLEFKKRNKALFFKAVHILFFWLFSKPSMSIIVKILSPAVRFLHLWLLSLFPAAGVFLLTVSIHIIWALAHITTAPELLSPTHGHWLCVLCDFSSAHSKQESQGSKRRGVITRRLMKCCEEEVGISRGFKKRRNRKKCLSNILWTIIKHRSFLGVHGLGPYKAQEMQRPKCCEQGAVYEEVGFEAVVRHVKSRGI